MSSLPIHTTHPVMLFAFLACITALSGCEQLCGAGLDLGSCPSPCAPVEPTARWQSQDLAELINVEGAVLCEATEAREGARAQASIWLPGGVHDANMRTVRLAQDSDWSRARDNWYASKDTSDMPKETLFTSWRGGLLKYNVAKKDAYGARWTISYDGYPELPIIPDHATFLTVHMKAKEDGEKDAFMLLAAFEDRVVPMWTVLQGAGVTSGVEAATSDTLYFAGGGRRHVVTYGADRKQETYSLPDNVLSKDDNGSIDPVGLDPQGRFTLVVGSRKTDKARIARLHSGSWSSTEIPGAWSGNLPSVSFSNDGTTFVTSQKQLLAEKDGVWVTAELKHKAALDGVVAISAGRAIVATEKEIFLATHSDGAIAMKSIAKMTYPKLHATSTDRVIARSNSSTLSIEGDESEKISFYNGSKYNGHANYKYTFKVGQDGSMVFLDKVKGVVEVRSPDGETTRYPKEGAFDQKLSLVWLDVQGRAYVTTRGEEFFVLEGGNANAIKDLAGYKPTLIHMSFKGDGVAVPMQ